MPLRFNADTPLYTSDASAWRMDDLNQVLDVLVKRSKPIVAFVHGRGKEPNKSLRGAKWAEGLAVHKVELGYDVSVLMFNWDSAFKGINFKDRKVPLSHTDAGGADLGKLLAGLGRYQLEHPGLQKPALLVHSMGSIVLQKAVAGGHWPAASGLFSSVLFSQPDADDVGHADWLDVLAKKENTFVTLNRDDHILLKSTDERPKGSKALGLDTKHPLARHAKYIDISRMGPVGEGEEAEKDDDHEVFGKGAMNGQVFLCEFFTQALTGKPVDLDPNRNVESIERGNVYRLRDHRKKGAPCLKVPAMPKFD